MNLIKIRLYKGLQIILKTLPTNYMYLKKYQYVVTGTHVQGEILAPNDDSAYYRILSDNDYFKSHLTQIKQQSALGAFVGEEE